MDEHEERMKAVILEKMKENWLALRAGDDDDLRDIAKKIVEAVRKEAGA